MTYEQFIPAKNLSVCLETPGGLGRKFNITVSSSETSEKVIRGETITVTKMLPVDDDLLALVARVKAAAEAE
jgi:hypothetical protein